MSVDPAAGSGLRGRHIPGSGEEARLERAAALLESEFLTYLFQAMRDTVPRESAGSDGASEIFWSMMQREIADRAALEGGYGLGEAFHRSLSTPPEDPR